MWYKNEKCVSFDVETTATQNLKAVGAKAYLRHPETDVILFAWHSVGAPEQPEVWFSGQPCPLQLREHVENGGVLTGWNTLSFDAVAWDVILVEKYGFPRIQRSQWQDSMQLAAAANLPRSLDGCAKAVGAPYQTDLKDNNILRRITNKIKTPVVQGADLEWLTNRCIQDVLMEEETLKRLPPWFSMPPWDRMREIDREINDRGILTDVELVKGLRKIAEEETRRLDKQMYELTGGAVRSTSVIESLKTWLLSRGVELPLKGSSPSDEEEDDDDEKEPAKAVYRLRKSDIADILARSDVPEDCRQALEWRQEAAKASVKKLKKMLESMDPDGRLRGALILGGAQQTLRWCIAEGTAVLVKDANGDVFEKPIESVLLSDMVWDGSEWVTHEGVVFSGEKDVIYHDGILATPTHKVFWGTFTKVPLQWAKKHAISIFEGDTLPPFASKTIDTCWMTDADGSRYPTYDIINAGPRNRFMANGKIVSNSGAAWQPHNFVRDSVGNADDIEITYGIKKSKNPTEFKRVTNLVIHNAINIGRMGDRDLAEMLCTSTRKDAQGRVRIEGVLPWVGRMLRRTLAAQEGHVFLESDYSQIEARIPVWLADQKDKVEAFRNGVDVYRLQASPIFGKAPENLSSTERQAGKVTILACGFAGGVGAFVPMAMNYGLRINREEAKPIVDGYRRDNGNLVAFWDNNLNAAIEAVMYPGKTVYVPPLNKIHWIMDGNCLMSVLPSGRPLRYWSPRLEQGYWQDGTAKNSLDLTALSIKGRAVFRRAMWRGIAVENCLGRSTCLLTSSGWKSVLEVLPSDKLWDGDEWVSHEGVIYKGVRETMDFGGVRITPDHKVWINAGWKSAAEGSARDATSTFRRYHRSPETLPNSRKISGPSCAQLSGGQDVYEAVTCEPVYDILNAGPRNRFTIRTADGHPFIVSNCTQAIAADLLAQALVNMKDAALPVVLHVHDAVIAEVHKTVAEKRLPEFEACMLSQPSWIAGLPIAVSSEITPRFG